MNNYIATKNESVKGFAGWLGKRVALIVFDILAGYFSFFTALVMRFFADGEFLLDGRIYLDTFYKLSPYFAVFIVCVFALFGLYSRRWKYAGFYDLVRIVFANATVFVLMFAVTYLFYIRMPLTYYFLGTGMLFCLTCLSRFSLATINYLLRKYRSFKHAAANVMIVGTGNTANFVRRQFENRDEEPANVKCFFAYDPPISQADINGAPVLNSVEKLEEYLNKYKINLVCLASRHIPPETEKVIREKCEINGIEIQDCSDALETDLYNLSYNKVVRCISGPVRVKNGKTVDYASGMEAAKAAYASRKIESISAEDGIVVVNLSTKTVEKNDINEEWVRKTEADTGENISFF